MLDREYLPRHVAIIMDGNGRWAKKRNLPRVMGHNAGMKAMKKIVKRSAELGISQLTVYAFSTENWKRSEEELRGIFDLLLKFVNSELAEIKRENVKIQILGDYNKFSQKVVASVEKAMEETKDNTGLVFNIALNYGSRNEIKSAIQEIAEKVSNSSLSVNNIDEELISKTLNTGKLNIPDPDLLIRTSGEVRLSNYLLWQLAYAEMVFTDTLWPDFTPEEYEKCLLEYQKRDRRFGGR
ncbi:MAG: isoprenyl transferase [Anaerovoracaceae bacterium]